MTDTQITQVFDQLGQKFGVAIDWSAENVLPVVTELCDKYISWEITTSAIWAVVSLLAIAFLGFIAYRVKKHFDGKQGEFDYIDKWGSIAVIGTIALFPIGCLIYQVFDIAQCLCFPEKAIFDYLMNMS